MGKEGVRGWERERGGERGREGGGIGRKVESQDKKIMEGGRWVRQGGKWGGWEVGRKGRRRGSGEGVS